jgi:uncharacterized protein YndB with AHSA1/START domain
MTHTELQTIGGKPVLRFERLLRHPPDKVWAAVTEPDQMRHWFPASVETDLVIGAPMRFRFEGDDDATPDPMKDGEILELDPPKVYAFRWNEDVLRFELLPQDEGCLLVFTHALAGGALGRLAAGRNAAGWDTCLDSLDASLAERETPPAGEFAEAPAGMIERIEAYVGEFGLDEGEVTEGGDEYVVRFARDLIWKPIADVWALLTEGQDPQVGQSPPLRLTNGYVEAGSVTAVEAPEVLEYTWVHDGAAAGRVRFVLVQDPALGNRAELTQTIPRQLADRRAEALAAWHTHLELMFAAVQGQVRCWPQGRTEELTERYRKRLEAGATG